MSNTPTAEALAAQAFMATSCAFAGGVFAPTVFDVTPHALMSDRRGVPLAEIALRCAKDPNDPVEIARAAGGQGSVRQTQGLYAAEIAQYPFGSHQPSL